ncbi:hypothetical protein VP01_8654g1, partial [Puccinia sorghi]
VQPLVPVSSVNNPFLQLTNYLINVALRQLKDDENYVIPIDDILAHCAFSFPHQYDLFCEILNMPMILFTVHYWRKRKTQKSQILKDFNNRIQISSHSEFIKSFLSFYSQFSSPFKDYLYS